MVKNKRSILRRRRRHIPTQRKRIAVALLSLPLLANALLGLGDWWFATHRHLKPPVVTQQLNDVVTQSNDQPDETRVVGEYTVPADQPRRIILPSLDTTGYIQKVGIDQSNAIAVPANIHFAGWYINSVKPGDKGLSIIDGHVQGRYGNGIFKHLTELKAGDEIQVEYGDLTKRSFTVKSVVSLSTADADVQLFSTDSKAASRLKLITCGGQFDTKKGQYNQRVIVTAELR